MHTDTRSVVSPRIGLKTRINTNGCWGSGDIGAACFSAQSKTRIHTNKFWFFSRSHKSFASAPIKKGHKLCRSRPIYLNFSLLLLTSQLFIAYFYWNTIWESINNSICFTIMLNNACWNKLVALLCLYLCCSFS